jgi:NAD(P)-dependent dehydrogenase (short-subunit alcohol dehydrogenase family)
MRRFYQLVMVDAMSNVVVTGGTGALGSGVVASLLARGMTCHLPIVEAALPERAPWRSDPRVVAHPNTTLDDDAKVTAFYATLPDLWASVHLVGGFAMGPITETSLADFETQWRLNAGTCFLTCREAVRTIKKGNAGGRIVNVAARVAVVPAANMVAYSASKAAVAMITQSLAAEVSGDGILVNAVLPSIIDSPANRKSMPDADFSRWPKPAELAETIAFLASRDNALTSGALIPVYGRA